MPESLGKEIRTRFLMPELSGVKIRVGEGIPEYSGGQIRRGYTFICFHLPFRKKYQAINVSADSAATIAMLMP